MMMGADYYQTESEIAAALAEEKVPIGVGRNTKIMWVLNNCPLPSGSFQLEKSNAYAQFFIIFLLTGFVCFFKELHNRQERQDW